MKDGLVERLTAEKSPSAVLIIESMQSILQDKQTAPRIPNGRLHAILSSQVSYAEVALLLEKPLQMAKNLAILEKQIQIEEVLLQNCNAKSKQVAKNAMQTLLIDHQKQTELLKAQLKTFEERNGQLTKEIENPPEKQIAAVHKKIAACNKSIESLGDLISKLDNSEHHIKRVMDQINNRVRERDDLQNQLKALKVANVVDPKIEQKQVREQMIAIKKNIADRVSMSNESILMARQDQFTKMKSERKTQQTALFESLSQVRNTRGINNETNDLLREGLSRITAHQTPPPKSHKGQAYR